MTTKNDIGAFISDFTIEGAKDGPLHGLSFAAKDLYDIAGHVTGAGNPKWARTHSPAKTHAPVVARLLAAGARLTGKTITDELAYSLMGINAHYGTPLNSAAPDRVPGGSSSGSAAAVAAGAVDFALGTDTGGSVRGPASFCGLYGLRPTHGLLPPEGVVPLAPSFDTVGWFARDMDIMIKVGGALGIEAAMTGKPRLSAPSDLWALAEPETREALRPMKEKAEALFGSAATAPLNPDSYDAWREVFRICQGYEAWAAHGAWISTHAPDFSPDVRARFEAGSQVTAEEERAARQSRVKIAALLDAALDGGTVIVLPTVPAPAPLKTAEPTSLDAFRASALSLLCPAGLGGLPQISIPAAHVDGAPVGLSLLGARGSDGMLLAMARDLTRGAA